MVLGLEITDLIMKMALSNVAPCNKQSDYGANNITIRNNMINFFKLSK